MRAKLKGAIKSLTIWFNSIAGTAAVALPYAKEQLPALQSYVPHDFFQYAMAAVIIGNIVIRFKTNSSLEQK